MLQSGISLELRVNGRPVTEYTKDGKIFIEGRKGSKYDLVIRNNSSTRKRVVVSVDGQNVINGEQADYNGPAYILSPWQTTVIDGWRVSNEEVRQFVFSAAGTSRSEKMGEGTNNCGVIAVAAFNEKYSYNWQLKYTAVPYNWNDYTIYNMAVGGLTSETLGGSAVIGSHSLGTRSLTASETTFSASVADAAPVNSLGTQMGEAKQSVVHETTFDSEALPFTTLALYYYERRELEKMGIIVKPVPAKLPDPFPKQFCKVV